MNAVVLTEIVTKLVVMNLIRYPLICFSEKRGVLETYICFMFIRFFVMLLWDITIIVLFSISTGDCLDDAVNLWVAILLVFIESCVAIIMKLCILICSSIAVAAMLNSEAMRHLRQLTMDRRSIVEMIKQIKKLKLDNNEFN